MSCLDLSFTSPSVFNYFKWDVIDNPYGSDDLPVKITWTFPPQIIPKEPRRWKLHLADWALFQEQACLEKVFSPALNVDELNERFTRCIITAVRLAIPRSSGAVQQNRKSWYTQECREGKKKQHKAWGILRRYPTHENLIHFKKGKRQSTPHPPSSRKSSWKSYVSSINSSITSKQMWQQVHRLNGSFSPFTIPLLTAPDTQTSLAIQADILGQHFSKVSSSTHYTQTFLLYKRMAEKERLPTICILNESYNSQLHFRKSEKYCPLAKRQRPALTKSIKKCSLTSHKLP